MKIAVDEAIKKLSAFAIFWPLNLGEKNNITRKKIVAQTQRRMKHLRNSWSKQSVENKRQRRLEASRGEENLRVMNVNRERELWNVLYIFSFRLLSLSCWQSLASRQRKRKVSSRCTPISSHELVDEFQCEISAVCLAQFCSLLSTHRTEQFFICKLRLLIWLNDTSQMLA